MPGWLSACGRTRPLQESGRSLSTCAARGAPTKVDGQVRHRGSTAEIDHKAENVFAWLGFIASIQPGTVVDMGTIPDCTDVAHDDFSDPGAEIEIGFERAGTLHCRFAEPARKLMPKGWPLRPALQKFHSRQERWADPPRRGHRTASDQTATR